MINQTAVHGQQVSIAVEPLEGLHGTWCDEESKISIDPFSKVCQWRILAHEMTHAGLDISGLSELISSEMIEAICTAMEMTFGPLLKNGRPFEDSNHQNMT